MSQPRGSGESEMNVAQRICAADIAQRIVWASPAARIKLPKEGAMQPGGKDKMRKEGSFLNKAARLRRAGWETRLLIKLSNLRWQRVWFFQEVCSTQLTCIFSEHCQLMPAHTPTPPNILSAHPIKEKAPPGIRTSPKMYLEYKKTQKRLLGVYWIPNIFAFWWGLSFFLGVISGKGNRSCEGCLKNLKLLSSSWKRHQPRDYNRLTSKGFILLRSVCS